MKKNGLLSSIALAAAAAATMHAGPAEACGGCFVPPADVSVVTDHRMALSISQQQTILWDQIRYSGDPREFAWVLPVRAGAKIELANDEFFAALDASTQPTVYAPQGQNTFGCALTGCGGGEDSDLGAASNGNGGVQIISQSVVGPYDQVTLRATDDGALVKWLRSNQFAIPTAIEPTIQAYVNERFDFIALKLRPECGQRSMKPVRVVSPGSVPSLPLRMVAAGVGPKVGITLYVITEGKYQPQNFPHVLIPDEKLRWDRYQNKSNYEPISQDLMAQANGRTWIVEYANQPQLPIGKGWQDPSRLPAAPGSNNFRSPGLATTYFSQCKYYRPANNPYVTYTPSSTSSSSSGGVDVTPCPEPDAGLSSKDAGLDSGQRDAGGDDDDASTDAGDTTDAGDAGDAGNQQQGDDDDNGQSSSGFSSSSSSGYSSSSSGYTPKDPYANPERDCVYLDDLDAALDGLSSSNVWVTRMRALLPSSTLTDGDLLVEPSKLPDGRADTETVSNIHWTPYYADDDLSDDDVKSNCAGSPRRYHRPYASYTALVIFGAAVAVTLARRHRRPKKKP